MKTVIIKYNAGNTRSVIYALERIGITPILSDDVDTIRSADKVIFPGVGEASTTMQYLKKAQLDQLIPMLKQPVLGICLGMQLMCSHSEEGDTIGMGIFDAEVKHFQSVNGEKIPHMGWNNLATERQSWLREGIIDEDVYFVHSYYVPKIAETAAVCNYILPFSAALQKDNFYAVQFHPEKSGVQGEQILKNFLAL